MPAAGGPLVVRVANAASAGLVTGDLAREAALVPLLEARGLPVPREMRAVRDDDGTLLATIHRLVPGSAAKPLPRGQARAALARNLGRFLSQLHAVPASEARAAGVPSLDLWSDRYAGFVEECAPALGARSAAWLHGRVRDFLDAGGSSEAPRVLVHGDLGAPHVIVDERGALRGVIDFGDAMLADPAIDAAALRVSYPQVFVDAVLADYDGVVDEAFRSRAQFYTDVVPLFLLRYGHMFNGGHDRVDGVRQFAARAAAASRAARA